MCSTGQLGGEMKEYRKKMEVATVFMHAHNIPNGENIAPFYDLWICCMTFTRRFPLLRGECSILEQNANNFKEQIPKADVDRVEAPGRQVLRLRF